jgi:phospholipase C
MSAQRNEQPGGARESGGQPSRRRLLKAGLAAGLVAGTGGWRAAGSAAAKPLSRRLREPGERPFAHLPKGTDTIPQIQHIVVLMMENHSYDNHLGMLGRPGADGFTLGPDGMPTATNPYADGRIQHAFRMPTTCQLPSAPTQSWAESHTQLAGGQMNGFVKSGSGPVAMGYWQGEDLPFYYSLASTFPIADRYFASVLGQTWPNRRYLMAATSIGMIDDTTPGALDYPAGGTIFDRLHDAGVSWNNYVPTTSPEPTMALFPPLVAKYPTGPGRLSTFFSAAAKGKLPGFSLVDPNFGKTSEENPQNIAVGERFAAKVINAVMTGPAWKSTLLILVFDEGGGYYDHVVPPAAIAPDDIPPETNGGPAFSGFGQYGFRVPCVVVSPWARPNYVSHQVFDHTSICALLETKWNLPALTRRDANANNMLDMLDLNNAAFATPPRLAPPLIAVNKDQALACNSSGPGTIPPPGSIS